MFSLGTLIRSQYLRYGNKKFGCGIGAVSVLITSHNLTTSKLFHCNSSIELFSQFRALAVRETGIGRSIRSFSKQEDDLVSTNDILTQEYDTESVATHCILRYADNYEGYFLGQTISVLTWVKGEPKHSAIACFLSRSRC